MIIPGVTLFDLMASYDFKNLTPQLKGLHANLDVSNLLDRRYIASCYGASWCWFGPGRDVRGSLSYRW